MDGAGSPVLVYATHVDGGDREKQTFHHLVVAFGRSARPAVHGGEFLGQSAETGTVGGDTGRGGRGGQYVDRAGDRSGAVPHVDAARWSRRVRRRPAFHRQPDDLHRPGGRQAGGARRAPGCAAPRDRSGLPTRDDRDSIRAAGWFVRPAGGPPHGHGRLCQPGATGRPTRRELRGRHEHRLASHRGDEQGQRAPPDESTWRWRVRRVRLRNSRSSSCCRARRATSNFPKSAANGQGEFGVKAESNAGPIDLVVRHAP